MVARESNISEQARERATEIRTTTVWNGKGTADLLDALADEIENLEQTLKDAGSALSQAEATARAYQQDLRDARAEARYG